MATNEFREFREKWRNIEENLQGIEREYTARQMSVEEVDELRSELLAKRNDDVWYLRRRFGFDAVATPPRWMLDAHPPFSDDEHAAFAIVWASYMTWHVAIQRIYTEAVPLPAAERGAMVLDVYLWCARELRPHLIALLMRSSPSERVRDLAIISLSAWVETKTSLSTNKRLSKQLDYEGVPLSDLLPGRIWLASQNIRTLPWDVQSFVSAVVNPLTQVSQLPDQGRRRTHMRVEAFPEDVELIRDMGQDPEEALLLREAIAEAEKQQRANTEAEVHLFRVAGLTEQQVEIRRLSDQGLAAPTIAARLGTTPGNVRQQLLKAKRKYEKYQRKAN